MQRMMKVDHQNAAVTLAGFVVWGSDSTDSVSTSALPLFALLHSSYFSMVGEIGETGGV